MHWWELQHEGDSIMLLDDLQYFSIFGYSRSKMSDEEFRDLICENLACRLSDGEDCSKTMDHFLERCFYVPVRAYQLASQRQDLCKVQLLGLVRHHSDWAFLHAIRSGMGRTAARLSAAFRLCQEDSLDQGLAHRSHAVACMRAGPVRPAVGLPGAGRADAAGGEVPGRRGPHFLPVHPAVHIHNRRRLRLPSRLQQVRSAGQGRGCRDGGRSAGFSGLLYIPLQTTLLHISLCLRGAGTIVSAGVHTLAMNRLSAQKQSPAGKTTHLKQGALTEQ